MAIIKVLSKVLVFLGAFYVCVRYVGDFSTQQSAVLTFLAWICYELYSKLSASRRVESIFEPFSVSIYPNWYELLSDFKLIGGIEEWHRLREGNMVAKTFDRLRQETEKVPVSEYSVFRSGFHFTVIRPASDGPLPGLTFWDNRKIFLREVELSESIIELEDKGIPTPIVEEHPFFKHPKWGGLPRVSFKPFFDGYELGLEVQYDWWKHLCEAGEVGELAKIKTHEDYERGATRLVIATLPCSEFGIYYDVPVDRMEEWEKVRDKQLETNGWKRKIEGDSEIRHPWSHVEHKYFTVSHQGI